jgi:excisionase family DNA binding protein
MSEWVTVDEAMQHLKVSRSTLYRWCDEGRLRYYELESGGGRRFKRDDLDRMLKPGPSKEDAR